MENYTLHRGRLIDHIQLVVNNFDASKTFYTAVLAELKIPLVITDDEYIDCSIRSQNLIGSYKPGFETICLDKVVR